VHLRERPRRHALPVRVPVDVVLDVVRLHARREVVFRPAVLEAEDERLVVRDGAALGRTEEDDFGAAEGFVDLTRRE